MALSWFPEMDGSVAGLHHQAPRSRGVACVDCSTLSQAEPHGKFGCVCTETEDPSWGFCVSLPSLGSSFTQKNNGTGDDLFA